MVKRIVLTGGPSSGKTSVLEKIDQVYSAQGYKVILVDETATYLINKGITKNVELQKEAIKFVSATAHAKIFIKLKELLNEDELEFFKKGRNNFSKAHRKNINLGEYAITGIASLV